MTPGKEAGHLPACVSSGSQPMFTATPGWFHPLLPPPRVHTQTGPGTGRCAQTPGPHVQGTSLPPHLAHPVRLSEPPRLWEGPRLWRRSII